MYPKYCIVLLQKKNKQITKKKFLTKEVFVNPALVSH